jgi:Protein of unknown function (DUF4245)
VTRPPTGAERQRLRSPANLWRALIPLLVLVGALVAFAWPRAGSNDGVHVVDIVGPIAAARQNGLAVLTPTGLDPRWRPTSVDYTQEQLTNGQVTTPASLRIGFVSPAGDYAELMQSDDVRNGSVLASYGSLDATNPVKIGTVSWDGFQTSRNRELIRLVSGNREIIVTGSASAAELSTLAGSLR